MIRALMGLVTGGATSQKQSDGALRAGGPGAALRVSVAESHGESHAAGIATAGRPATQKGDASSFRAELSSRTNAGRATAVRAAGSTGLAFTPGWEEPPVSAGEAARLRWAAEQLEALFLEQLWRGMRRTVMKTGMLDGPGVELFEEMLDQERARAMAAAGTLGLADMVYEQMSRYINEDAHGRTTRGSGKNM